MNNEFTDNDPMPFGKYKGVKLLDVPASYFHYLWQSGMKHEVKTNMLAKYISDNLSGLKDENSDLIWS